MPETAALLLATRALTDSVDELTDRFDLQEETLRRQKVGLRLVAASVVLDVVLSIALGVFGWGLNGAQEQIRGNQEQISALSAQNAEAFCALMGIFFTGEKVSTTAPYRTEEEKAQVRASYVVLHKLARDVGCPEGNVG